MPAAMPAEPGACPPPPCGAPPLASAPHPWALGSAPPPAVPLPLPAVPPPQQVRCSSWGIRGAQTPPLPPARRTRSQTKAAAAARSAVPRGPAPRRFAALLAAVAAHTQANACVAGEPLSGCHGTACWLGSGPCCRSVLVASAGGQPITAAPATHTPQPAEWLGRRRLHVGMRTRSRTRSRAAAASRPRAVLHGLAPAARAASAGGCAAAAAANALLARRQVAPILAAMPADQAAEILRARRFLALFP